MRSLLCLLITFVCIQLGCSSWYAQPGETSTSKPISSAFQKLRMSPDSVVIEVAVARIELDRREDFEQFWNEIDTSTIPLANRKRLDQNGIRAGVISSQLPAVLQSLLEPQPIDVDSLSGMQKQMYEKGILEPEPRYLLHDGIQNRSGETHSVPVTSVLPNASWTINNESSQIVGAGEHVRGFIELLTYPNGNGTVRLVCTPCLHLGEPKMQIAVQGEGFIYESTSDKNQLEDLRFESSLKSGQTLILAPTSDMGDLGGLLFGSAVADRIASNTSNTSRSFRILLVRILQTQMDDLFAPVELKEKLTTATLD